VLVLDEPTNDLDIDTLDLLEELLQTTTARCSWSAMTAPSGQRGHQHHRL
jgi:ABC-type cobalamin/Fe3+-siderophores transport system ATPase subunit